MTWEENGMDTDAFQKPDRIVLRLASVAKSGGGGGAAKVQEGLVMEKFRGDPKGGKMFKQIGF